MPTFVCWLLTEAPFCKNLQKNIRSHVSCLSGCKGKSNFDCPTWEYPMYELLYRSVPSPFFKIYNAIYIHYIRFSLGKKSCFHGSKREELRQGRTKWRNCRLTTKKSRLLTFLSAGSWISMNTIFILCTLKLQVLERLV